MRYRLIRHHITLKRMRKCLARDQHYQLIGILVSPDLFAYGIAHLVDRSVFGSENDVLIVFDPAVALIDGRVDALSRCLIEIKLDDS